MKKGCLVTGPFAFQITDLLKVGDTYILLFPSGKEVIVENEKDLVIMKEPNK